jgi:hypothetical protein
MRVWTDGDVHVVVGETGVEVHRPKQPPALFSPGKRATRGWPPRDVLAVVGREPLLVWVGSGKEVRVVALDPPAKVERTIVAHVLDAVGLGDGRVLACLATPGQKRARLVVVDGAAEDLADATELALPAVTRIEWPGGIWEKDAVPWPEDDVEEDEEPTVLDALAVGRDRPDGGVGFDEVQCAINEHGLTVTGVAAGVVAVLPPDASRVDFAVRVPTTVEETEIFAARTAEGVVIVVTVEGRHSAILHVAPDGKVIASRHKIGKELAWGMGPPVVQGDKVIVFEVGEGGEDRLHDIKLDGLTVAKSSALGERPTGRISAWAAPGGASFLLGLGARAATVKRAARGALAGTLLDKPPPPAAAPRALPPAIPLASGPPTLALARSSERPQPWEMGAGQPLTIAIPFTNQGGASKGIAFELGGAALQGGLVQPVRVRVGEVEAPLVMKGSVAKGELGALPLVAGFAIEPTVGKMKPLPPPPAPVQVAYVDVVGVKAGSAVLTVRITPLHALPSRGSVLQGKAVTVRG